MDGWLSRSALLYGEAGIQKLNQARVAVLGLGGVGSGVVEALCRSGVGNLLLVDSDVIDITNCNRQIVATQDNVGRSKTEEMKKRILSIHPQCNVVVHEEFYLPNNSDFVYDFHPDCVVDAIDTVTAKLHLAQQCQQKGIPLFCCLGTGNRLDPSQLRLGDISLTQGTGCPLARVMRRELRKQGIHQLTVVYSQEKPIEGIVAESSVPGRNPPGSAAFVPPAAGLLLASAVVRKILNWEQ